jgi:hypothetical protein
MDPNPSLSVTRPPLWPVRTKDGNLLQLSEVVPKLMDVKMDTPPEHIRKSIFTEYGIKFSLRECATARMEILNIRVEEGSKGMDPMYRAHGFRAKSLGHAQNQSVQARWLQRPDLLQNKSNASSDSEWGYVDEVERPNVCGTCQRSFARLELLNGYEQSHTKEREKKPFECPECARCFARRDLLLRHQQKMYMVTTPSSTPGNRHEGGNFQEGFAVDSDGSDDSRSAAPAVLEFDSEEPSSVFSDDNISKCLKILDSMKTLESFQPSGEASAPVQLDKVAQTFKKMAGKAWKSSATFANISYTISRDNTSGESARQAKLFAEFAGRGRPCILISSQKAQRRDIYDQAKNEFGTESAKDVVISGQTDIDFGPSLWQCVCKFYNPYKFRSYDCLQCGASRPDAVLRRVEATQNILPKKAQTPQKWR